MTISAVAVSLLLMMQTGKGSIEGTVVSTTTNKPIAGAQVTAMRMGPAIAAGQATGATGVILGVAGGFVAEQGGPSARPSATTDSSGRFIFHDLEPGRYMIQAGADGYARQQTSPLPEGQAGMTTTLDVTAGQSATAAVLHLTAGGNISGRVTGANGEPLVGMDITLFQQNYSIGGRRNLGQVGNGQTNDRGEYRMFWVAPGRYYVTASSSNRPTPGMPFMGSGSNNKYPRTYYPAATNMEGATEVEILPGGELAGIDFRLAPEPLYKIRGRIVDAATGQIPRTASIGIIPRDGLPTGFSATNSPYNPADGTFELRDVLPGSYWVRAQLPMSAPLPGSNAVRVAPPMAITAVEVRGNDIDNVVLTVQPPFTISGRIRFEGQTTPGRNLRIALQPAMNGPLLGPLPQAATINADGTFQIANVSPGEYQLAVPGIGPTPTGVDIGGGLYIKEARLGNVDALKDTLTIDGPVSGELQIVVATNAGQITGTVTDDRALPARVLIVIVPDQRERRDLYKTNISDATGRYTVRQIPPGSYKVFAMDQALSASFFNPAVIRKYEQNGKAVIVGESATVSVDLRLIR